jgi:hypothetical protein
LKAAHPIQKALQEEITKKLSWKQWLCVVSIKPESCVLAFAQRELFDREKQTSKSSKQTSKQQRSTSNGSPTKLRIAFGAAPFGLIVKKSGGKTSDGVRGGTTTLPARVSFSVSSPVQRPASPS